MPRALGGFQVKASIRKNLRRRKGRMAPRQRDSDEGPVVKEHAHVPCLLGHPVSVRIGRHAGDVDRFAQVEDAVFQDEVHVDEGGLPHQRREVLSQLERLLPLPLDIPLALRIRHALCLFVEVRAEFVELALERVPYGADVLPQLCQLVVEQEARCLRRLPFVVPQQSAQPLVAKDICGPEALDRIGRLVHRQRKIPSR